MTSESANLGRRVEALVAEYLERLEREGHAEIAPFVERLGGESERREFEDLVRSACSARALLPRRISSGTVLGGRYRVLHELGRGGMGKVFAALDLQLERQVALKVMHALDLGDAQREALFERESRLLAALQHPGIVAVHDLGHDADLTYIAMDLIDGTPLDRVLDAAHTRLESLPSGERARRLDAALLAECIDRPTAPGRESLIDGGWYRSVGRIAAAISGTIEAAHERGVVHRDLKPGNVMLTGGGQPVVFDFGLAGRREGGGGAVTEGFHGSAAYVAPEQARTLRSGADPRSDIYQLGLVLYELLTLERAFPGDELERVLEDVRLGRFATPRDVQPLVPRELEAICLRALELSPEARYGTAGALRQDLERYLRGELPLALRTHRWRRFVHRARRFVRAQPTVSALALALALSTLAWGGWRAYGAIHWFDVDFLRLQDGTAFAPAPLAEGDTLAPRDRIGFELRTLRPAHLYAFSTWIDRAGERFVAPVGIYSRAELEQLSALEPARADEWELQKRVEGSAVGVGTQTLVCATAEANSQEGLWVFVCRDRNPALQDWIERMGLGADLAPRVAHEDALALLDDPGRRLEPAATRGGRAAPMRAPGEPANRHAGTQETLQALSRGLRGEAPATPDIRILRPAWPVSPLER